MDLLDLDSSSSKKFVIGKEAQELILSISRWGKFLAILGFTIGTIFVMCLILYYMVSLRNIKFQQNLGAIFAISSIVYFIPSNFLFKGSDRLKMGVNKLNSYDIREGFEYIKSMYRFMGIYFIVILLFTLYGYRKEIISFFN